MKEWSPQSEGGACPLNVLLKKKKSHFMSRNIQSVLGGHPRVSRGAGSPGCYVSWPTDNCGISQEGVVNFEVKGSEFIMF